MNSFDIELVPYLASGIVACTVVATYAWFNRQTRGGRLFALAVFAACSWMLGDVIGRCGTTYQVKYLGEVVRYFGVVNVPVWLFAFTHMFCGKVLTRRTLALLLVIPAVTFGMMVTSQWHRWFFTEMAVASYGLRTSYGPYFWYVHTPYSYVLMLLSLLLVLSEIGRVPRQFRSPIIFLALSLCVPLAINLVGLSGRLPEEYNTALSFPVFVMILSVGVFRHRLLSINPIAYESVFQNGRDGVMILSRDDLILDINFAAARYLDQARPQLIGGRLQEVFASWGEMLAKCADKREIADEFVQVRNGQQCHYSLHTANFIGIDNELDGRILTLGDITAHKQYQDALETLAYLDPLTRVANRRRFQEEVEKALQRAARHEECFAILFFDLNEFKAVNDTLGHETGDELLKHVGARTSAILRAPDFVARLGGDEFVILLHHATAADLNSILVRLRGYVEQPVTVRKQTLTPSLSIGTALYPQDGNTVQDLLRHADAAMYRAKNQMKS